jgi:hypothetical protein
VARISKKRLDGEVRTALRNAGLRAQAQSCVVALWSDDDEAEASERDYAWVLLEDQVEFGFSRKILVLDDDHRRAIVAHEVGHVLAWTHYGDDSEDGADEAAEQFLGVPICYDHDWPGKGLQVDCRIANPKRGRMKNPSAPPTKIPRNRFYIPNEKWVVVPSAWLRPDMIVAAPKWILDSYARDTSRSATSPLRKIPFDDYWGGDSPDFLHVEEWDWDEGESKLHGFDPKTRRRTVSYVDANTNDYPASWYVAASSIDDIDAAAIRQGQYPPNARNPKRGRMRHSNAKPTKLTWESNGEGRWTGHHGALMVAEVQRGDDVSDERGAWVWTAETQRGNWSTWRGANTKSEAQRLAEKLYWDSKVRPMSYNPGGRPTPMNPRPANAPFDRVPSVKSLSSELHVDTQTAKKLHAVLQGDDDTIDDVLGPSQTLSYQSGRMPMRDLAMRAADKLLGTHGVEEAQREPWGDSSKYDFEYLNAGDSYAATLLFRGRRVWISTWGDEVEGLERRGIRFENPNAGRGNPSQRHRAEEWGPYATKSMANARAKILRSEGRKNVHVGKRGDQWVVTAIRTTPWTTRTSPRNPYQGDAVELAKYRKARERWEREGRRGPPPMKPRSRNPKQKNPAPAVATRAPLIARRLANP